jgi:glycosyltransferase involved in cell wall biosynthesis
MDEMKDHPRPQKADRPQHLPRDAVDSEPCFRKFSIAIPVLGQEAFVPTAIASLLAQNQPLELAIMDATPGPSIQALLNPLERHIVYNRHGSDSGQAAAIAEGWQHTTGDIVSWLCADDYLFPNALEEVARVFSQHPEVGVVYGDSVLVTDSGDFLGYFPAISEAVTRLSFQNCISQPACFVRRKAIEAIGGINPELHYVMDWDLWTRLHAAGTKFQYLERPLAVVRMYPDTKTSSRAWKRYAELYAHLRRHASPMQTIRALVGSYLYDLGAASSSAVDKALLAAALFGLRLKKRLLNQAVSAPWLHYGFDLSTGLVRGSANVTLPWYSASPPRKLGLTVHAPGPVSMTLNGEACEISSLCVRGETTEITAEPPLVNANVLDIRLVCSTGHDWRLARLRVD